MIFRLQQRKKNFESSKKPLVCLKTSGFIVGWLGMFPVKHFTFLKKCGILLVCVNSYRKE